MSKAKTVVFYSISTHLGGAEKSLLDILKNLKSASSGQLIPHAVFPAKTGPLLDLLKNEGIPYTIVPLPEAFLKLSRNDLIHLPLGFLRSLPGLVSYTKELNKTIAALSPSYIHTTGIKCHFLSALLIKKIPIVWHFRDLLSSTVLKLAFQSLHDKKRIGVIANSQATAKSLPFPATVIHNGINLSAFAGHDKTHLHKLLNLDINTPLIGILGVLARWKGQREFLQIAKKLIDSGHKAQFVVIGDVIYDTTGEAGYKEELIELAKELKIQGRIHFTGFIKNPEAVLPSLSVLVHCSLKPEPFGRVLVEAMASGVPVVAADDGGVREIIEHGKTGWLCEPGDVEAYLRSINEASNPERNDSVIQSAFHFARGRFSLEVHMRRIAEFYMDGKAHFE